MPVTEAIGFPHGRRQSRTNGKALELAALTLSIHDLRFTIYYFN
jgi:hypothetical protein